MGKLKALFVSEAVTLAHIVRPLVISRYLPEDTFDTYFASSDAFPYVWQNEKITRIPLNSRSPRDFQAILSRGGVLFDEKILSQYVQEELALFERYKPDIVFGDLRPSLAVSSAVAGIPYINITSAYWSPHCQDNAFPFPCIEPLSKLLPKGWLGNVIVDTLSAVNRPMLPKILAAQGEGISRVRARYGLSPYPDYLSGFVHADAVFYTDDPLVVSVEALPPHQHYIGPISWSPSVSSPPWLDDLEGGVVYISMGSSGWKHILPTIVNALRTFKGSIVVATGGQELSIKGCNALQGAKIYTADYLSGDDMCKRASLVICNGGSPSVYQALSHGVPVIGIPCNMDQLLFMQSITRKKLGVSLRADTLRPRTIMKSVEGLLHDPALTLRVKRVAQSIHASDQKQLCLNLIDTLLERPYDRAASL